MEYLKHKYSHRVYLVMRDHNPEKPYLRCPTDSVVRHLPLTMMERFFSPCKSGVCPEDRKTIKEEMDWEKKKMGNAYPVKPLKAPRQEKDPRPTKPKAHSPKGSSGASYTLKDLCSELGTSPSTARKILRSQGKSAPDGGWRWSNAEEAKGIKKILKKYL